MRDIINFTISKTAQNFHEEFFVIPHEIKSLYIDIKLPEECRYMGYIILRDEKGAVRLQKLLGYGEQKLAIGSDGETTTVGGVPGKIMPGEWKVGLGIFTEYVEQHMGQGESVLDMVLTDEPGQITEPMGKKVWVKKNSTDMSFEEYQWSAVYRTGAGWYKGDFHTHTTLSDGKETMVNAMNKAKMMEMDFYVPTEHNLIHTGWCDTDICILPGVEITTEKGHFNLSEERYEGADLPSVAGDPGTYVFCEELSPETLIRQVRGGHICVTRFCRIIPKITAEGKEYLPGDEIEANGSDVTLNYAASIEGLNVIPKAYMIKNGEKKEIKVTDGGDNNYYISEKVCLTGNEWNWVRIEVRKSDGTFLGYVNPVFCGSKSSACKTIEEIWNKMNC